MRIAPLLILAFVCACPLPGELPATTTTTTTTTTSTSSSSSESSGCEPHFVQLGVGRWSCYCDTVMVDPALCGCTFDVASCDCPSYPCEEHSCELPCTPSPDGPFCECGSLVTPADYCDT